MLGRHKIRTFVLQALFEIDFNSIKTRKEGVEIVNRIVSDEEAVLDPASQKYLLTLFEGVLSKKKEIDEIIGEVAVEWPINKILIVDRNILRLSIFEILFGKDFETPPKVAINEAIELSKEFGGPSTSKFVNGILGTIYKNTDSEKVDSKVRKLKKSIGALAYAFTSDGIKFGILNDIFGKWTLSKCGILENETDDVAVRRVLKEELGIDCKKIKSIGKNAYTAYHPEDGPIRNEVEYYLAECEYSDIKLKKSGGLKDADWFTQEEALNLPMYKDLEPMIHKAIKEVVERKN